MLPPRARNRPRRRGARRRVQRVGATVQRVGAAGARSTWTSGRRVRFRPAALAACRHRPPVSAGWPVPGCRVPAAGWGTGGCRVVTGEKVERPPVGGRRRPGVPAARAGRGTAWRDASRRKPGLRMAFPAPAQPWKRRLVELDALTDRCIDKSIRWDCRRPATRLGSPNPPHSASLKR